MPPRPVTFRNTRIEANEFLFLVASRGAASIEGLHGKLYTRSLQPHLRRDLTSPTSRSRATPSSRSWRPPRTRRSTTSATSSAT